MRPPWPRGQGREDAHEAILHYHRLVYCAVAAAIHLQQSGALAVVVNILGITVRGFMFS
ncbi:hypothetical protein [Caldilinea sp.]|uniref:hypothetical protein n=1 Tax=Caldilinea sp. TaxID=2293560 RepID=UPI00262B6879|nr:hypothetical protein [Caldilinea sp.]